MSDAVPGGNRELADAIYETELLPKLLATEKGKILVLDVQSGDYAIGSDLLEASNRLQARQPGAYEYAFRIGYPAVGKLGLRGVAAGIGKRISGQRQPARRKPYLH